MKKNTANQLFDKVFKRIIRLSNISIINFINGLFNKQFPINSKVTYYSTENIKDNLEKNISDSMIGVNSEKFSLESQLEIDNTMVIRMFDYGYFDAIKTKQTDGNKISMKFPYPKIIYLDDSKNTPDEYILEFKFDGDHLEPFVFRVPTLKFLSLSIEDINKKNLIIMLPLYLLKLRKEISKNKSLENAIKLKDLIDNGLIKSIIENEKSGNITKEDKRILMEMIKMIYDNLYGGIDMFTMQKVTENLDRELIFEADLDRAEKQRLAKEKKLLTEQKELLANQNEKLILEKECIIKEMLKNNEPIEKIKRYFLITEEQIENIKKEINT